MMRRSCLGVKRGQLLLLVKGMRVEEAATTIEEEGAISSDRVEIVEMEG